MDISDTEEHLSKFSLEAGAAHDRCAGLGERRI